MQRPELDPQVCIKIGMVGGTCLYSLHLDSRGKRMGSSKSSLDNDPFKEERKEGRNEGKTMLMQFLKKINKIYFSQCVELVICMAVNLKLCYY